MGKPNPQQGQPVWTGRGLVAFLAVIPFALAAFTVGYGVGFDRGSAVGADPASRSTATTVDHPPVAATYTATGVDGSAPHRSAALPVGTSEGLGIAVTHLQYVVDESTVRPEHTAELRVPVLVGPEQDGTMLEVASVRPVGCLCALTSDAAPSYGTVWDTVVVDADATEVVFDVTGALDAPGRHGFAITTPDSGAYLELEGVDMGGPVLRTVSAPEPEPTAPVSPRPTPSEVPAAGGAERGEAGQAETNLAACRTGERLVPTCGALVGAAAGAHTDRSKERAFLEFEETVGRTQHLYHAYERGDRRLFPTPEQIELASDSAKPRTLFINWKPRMASWAEIAAGDPEVDAFLLRLADHIKANFDRPFLFTVHHEPENDVVQRDGSGMEASDYPEMFRYVVGFLRSQGVDNLVTVMNYMGYLKWVEKPWHGELYPGDDVVDWIGLSGYGQSLDDDGHSDFTEIVDQRRESAGWPGFYHWTGLHHPDKPVMLAEWGVFDVDGHPRHQETVYRAAAEQFAYYPRLKAVVYFSSPDAEGRDSQVDNDADTLAAFRDLMASRHFDVKLE
ncbi:glycoside hydrolase family 26 protein [Glycomyces halotolerans]